MEFEKSCGLNRRVACSFRVRALAPLAGPPAGRPQNTARRLSRLASREALKGPTKS